MRIVIEIDGDKVTAVGSEGTTREPRGIAPGFDAAATAPPPALLERAKKLGAMSAGGARFGIGAALAAVAPAGEAPVLHRETPGRASPRRRRKGGKGGKGSRGGRG